MAILFKIVQRIYNNAPRGGTSPQNPGARALSYALGVNKVFMEWVVVLNSNGFHLILN
jgi:hypothetical protein